MTARYLNPEQLEQTEEAILAPDGENLLQFMRAMFFGQTDQVFPPRIVDRACQLGWIRPCANDRMRLTDIGWLISDSAREYCNWIDDGRSLPAGLAPEDVAGKRVLDIGCGFGRYLMAMRREKAHVVGVEPSELYVQMSDILAHRERVDRPEIIRARAEHLPFAGEQFDIVLCIRSLQFAALLPAFSEIARVLTNGGKFIAVGCAQGTSMEALLSFFRHNGGVYGLPRKMLGFLNTLVFIITKRRLIRCTSKRTTAFPLRIPVSSFRECLTRVELSVIEQTPDDSLIVSERRMRCSKTI